MKKSLRLFFAHYYAEKRKKKLANISSSFFSVVHAKLSDDAEKFPSLLLPFLPPRASFGLDPLKSRSEAEAEAHTAFPAAISPFFFLKKKSIFRPLLALWCFLPSQSLTRGEKGENRKIPLKSFPLSPMGKSLWKFSAYQGGFCPPFFVASRRVSVPIPLLPPVFDNLQVFSSSSSLGKK